jgi:hypothetical protein
MGKLREKFFSELSHIEKLRAIKELSTKFGNNRKPGREPAGKPKKPRIALCDRLVVAIITIYATISN